MSIRSLLQPNNLTLYAKTIEVSEPVDDLPIERLELVDPVTENKTVLKAECTEDYDVVFPDAKPMVSNQIIAVDLEGDGVKLKFVDPQSSTLDDINCNNINIATSLVSTGTFSHSSTIASFDGILANGDIDCDNIGADDIICQTVSATTDIGCPLLVVDDIDCKVNTVTEALTCNTAITTETLTSNVSIDTPSITTDTISYGAGNISGTGTISAGTVNSTNISSTNAVLTNLVNATTSVSTPQVNVGNTAIRKTGTNAQTILLPVDAPTQDNMVLANGTSNQTFWVSPSIIVPSGISLFYEHVNAPLLSQSPAQINSSFLIGPSNTNITSPGKYHVKLGVVVTKLSGGSNETQMNFVVQQISGIINRIGTVSPATPNTVVVSVTEGQSDINGGANLQGDFYFDVTSASAGFNFSWEGQNKGYGGYSNADYVAYCKIYKES